MADVLLSPHFSLAEFAKDDPIPDSLVPIFDDLANLVLEPIRSIANAPFTITSGYRSQLANAVAHGQPNSEHMATDVYCACDFEVFVGDCTRTRALFDAVRNNATIPFHQIILEKSDSGTCVLHVSYNRSKPGVRSVLEGRTNNAAPYVTWTYAAYQGAPSSAPEDTTNTA